VDDLRGDIQTGKVQTEDEITGKTKIFMTLKKNTTSDKIPSNIHI